MVVFVMNYIDFTSGLVLYLVSQSERVLHTYEWAEDNGAPPNQDIDRFYICQYY